MEAFFDDAVPRESERWSRRPDCPVCSHLPASAAA